MGLLRRLLLAALVVAVGLLPVLAQQPPIGGVGTTPVLTNGLTNTVVTVKNARGLLFWANCINPAAADTYIQVFDTAGAITLGTTTPKAVFGIQAGAAGQMFAEFSWVGMTFFNSLKVAATTTPTGNVAPSVAITCTWGIT